MSEPAPEANPATHGSAGDRPKHISLLKDVPVFNCVVIVSPRNENGLMRARVANLPDMSVEAVSEREALQRLVAQFKQFVAARHAAGESIEWLNPPLAAEAGEQQRLIAVHL